MPQSLARVLLHVIFSTKHREPVIVQTMMSPLHSYLGGIARQLDCAPLQVGGIEDHVHILLGLGRTITIADLVKELKTGSSSWAKGHGAGEFAWQAGYGAFSVSESKVQEVIAYIRNQGEHHHHRTFQEEYREFLTRHGIACDERYVWD